MRARRGIALSLAVAATLAATAARSTDRPIAASTLTISRSASGREKLVFVSKDPSFLFPALASFDDPGTGTPGGIQVDLFPANSAPLGFGYIVLGGTSDPGWTSRDAAVDEHRYRNPDAPGGPSPVKSVVLKQGKRIKLVSRGVPSSLVGPHGAIEIRLTTGTLRNCALFDGPTIRHDEPDRFVARGAVASSLTDCTEPPPPTTTTTQPPYQPCSGGAGYPTCDGACPGTDECGPNFDPASGVLETCACFPAGAIPCVEAGYPTCGGACFGGHVCQGFRIIDTATTGCACAAPDSSCDVSEPTQCPGFGLCPTGQVCTATMVAGLACDCAPP
jgi:hypothetical protein